MVLNDYVRSHIPNSVNVDTFNTLFIFCYVYFLYVAIPCLKLNVAAAWSAVAGDLPYHHRLLRTTVP